ncbi:MAG: helix-turn-helix domain-containing protein [Coriobacteriia bacterium]|nr:helix-turn-helix domain-containing protein [Coriobacteriia bacterium]
MGTTIDRETFINLCDTNLKLVRTEYGLTQDEMAFIIGISKKTLVDIEKGRRSLGWMGSVALCHIFQDSDVIAGVFGGQPTDIVMTLAFTGRPIRYPSVTSKKAWWTVLYENEQFVIEQNIISQHFRLLTKDGRRVLSSFDLDEVLPIFNGSKTGGR